MVESIRTSSPTQNLIVRSSILHSKTLKNQLIYQTVKLAQLLSNLNYKFNEGICLGSHYSQDRELKKLYILINVTVNLTSILYICECYQSDILWKYQPQQSPSYVIFHNNDPLSITESCKMPLVTLYSLRSSSVLCIRVDQNIMQFLNFPFYKCLIKKLHSTWCWYSS